jgi:hypothetical protein
MKYPLKCFYQSWTSLHDFYQFNFMKLIRLNKFILNIKIGNI